MLLISVTHGVQTHPIVPQNIQLLHQLRDDYVLHKDFIQLKRTLNKVTLCTCVLTLTPS